MDDTRWDHGLKVTGEGEGLAGHAGAVLLRKLADQAGLTAALGSALARAREVPADRPRCGAGVHGGGDRAGGQKHKRHRPAGPSRAGLRRAAVRYHGAAGAGAGRPGHPAGCQKSACPPSCSDAPVSTSAVGDDDRPCPFVCCISSWSGSAAGLSCLAARQSPRTLSCWCCGMRSRYCAVPVRGPGWTGPTARSSPP